MLYPALLTLMHTPRLPVNWLVHFAERRNLVSARVPSHFNWPLITDCDHSQDTNRNTRNSKCNVCALQPQGMEESRIGSEVVRNVIGHCVGLGDVGSYRPIANVRALPSSQLEEIRRAGRRLCAKMLLSVQYEFWVNGVYFWEAVSTECCK